jgi:hypothetical protein
MAYYLNLFSPETYEAFGRSDRTISGFRPRQHDMAGRVQPGDLLVCYMTRLSRWVGLLEVVQGPFHENTPIFSAEDDPFTLRFRVKSLVWLPLEKTVPIHADAVWQGLSFTQRLPRGSNAWSGRVRGSLSRLSDADGAFLQSWLHTQAEGGEIFPMDADESRKLASHRVRRADKDSP